MGRHRRPPEYAQEAWVPTMGQRVQDYKYATHESLGQAKVVVPWANIEAREVTPLPSRADWLSRFTELARKRFEVFIVQVDRSHAQEWLASVSKMLDAMDCPERKRVKLQYFSWVVKLENGGMPQQLCSELLVPLGKFFNKLLP